jgi:hypothetical protein
MSGKMLNCRRGDDVGLTPALFLRLEGDFTTETYSWMSKGLSEPEGREEHGVAGTVYRAVR